MGCGPLAGSAAPIAAFVAITQTAGGTGQNPEQRGGPERQRRMAVGRLFCFAMQRPKGPAENSRTSAIAGPSRLPSDRPLEGRGRASPAKGRRDRAVEIDRSKTCAYTTMAYKRRK